MHLYVHSLSHHKEFVHGFLGQQGVVADLRHVQQSLMVEEEERGKEIEEVEEEERGKEVEEVEEEERGKEVEEIEEGRSKGG